MANPNPDRSGLRPPIAPGEVRNPGGKTSAQRKAEIANAEKATKLRGMMLDALQAKIEAEMKADPTAAAKVIEGDVLRLLKDSEDRGLGTASQSVDHTSSDGSMTPQATVYQLPSNGRD